MKIAVCAKQIPDPATPYTLDPDSHYVVRPNDQVLDDTDRYGVELALQIAEATEGTVTLVSMGPAGNLQGIRQALAMGADKAVVVDDEGLRGSGALVTAKVLAAAIEAEEADLVITGEGKLDGQTAFGKAPLGVAGLAKKHGIPVVALAGALADDAYQILDHGIDAIFSILPYPMTLPEAMSRTDEFVTRASEQIVRLILLKVDR